MRDMAENGPRSVQWNLALFDDDVFWCLVRVWQRFAFRRKQSEHSVGVVGSQPGSHRQLTPPDVAASIAADPHAPPPGALHVRLKAGDG